MPQRVKELFDQLKRKTRNNTVYRCSGCGRRFKGKDMVFDSRIWTCFECHTGFKAKWRKTWRGVYLPVFEEDQKGA